MQKNKTSAEGGRRETENQQGGSELPGLLPRRLGIRTELQSQQGMQVWNGINSAELKGGVCTLTHQLGQGKRAGGITEEGTSRPAPAEQGAGRPLTQLSHLHLHL